MGLCVLDDIEKIRQKRESIWQIYTEELLDAVKMQKWNEHSVNNASYAPILFDSEESLLKADARLKENDIFVRRYFYPSLDTLEYLGSKQVCKNSRDIASRILCLPMYPGLANDYIKKIINLIKED